MRRIEPQGRQRIIARIEQNAAELRSLANQVIMLATSRYLRLRVGDHRMIFDIKRGRSPEMVVLRA